MKGRRGFEGAPFGFAPKTTHGRFKGEDKVFAGLEVVMSITYRVDPRELVAKRRLNRYLREVNKEVMLHWHTHMRPVHFTSKGSSKYNYQRRTNATVIIKRERFGHNLPLKQKGAAESLTANIRALRATPTRGTLTMHGPWYLAHRTRRKRGGLSPDLKAELTRIDDADALNLARMGSKLLAARINAEKKRGMNPHIVKG